MSNSYSQSSILLYINGVRVPCSSVSVSCAEGGFSSASAQIPFHDILHGLGEEDLLQVAIFYLDQHYYTPPRYCLLFEGRMVGYSYSNSESSESISLSFESNMAILNDLSVNFISSTKKKGNKANKDYPSQIDIPTSAKKLLTTAYSGSPISRPFDIIENIIQAVSGDYRDKSSYVSTIDKSIKEKLKELTELYSRQILDRSSAIDKAKGRTSGTASIEEAQAQIVLELESKARSEGIPVDAFSSGSGEGFETTLGRYVAAKKTQEIKESASNYKDVVLSGFYSRHFRLIRFREHWMCSPYFEGIPDVEDPIKARLGGGVFPLLRSKHAKKFLKSLVKRTGEKMGPSGKAYSLISSLYGMMFYKMAEVLAPPCYIVDQYGLPSEGLDYYGDLASFEFKDYNAASQDLISQKKRPCIASFITTPQAPFAIPPSCNVIFPSTRTSLSINVSHTSTPTRVYYNRKSRFGRLNLETKAPGYNHTASRVGYPSIAAGYAQKAAASGSNDLEFLIFPEEYFRGPAPLMKDVHPSYMGIQEFANTARFSSISIEGNKTTVYDPDVESLNTVVQSADKMSADGYGAYGLYFLLAQKEYYNARAGATTASIASIFNPYIVVGMPCAVLSGDKSGSQYYGNITSVVHHLSASGQNSTQMSVTHMRSIKKDLKKVASEGAVTDISPQDPIREIRELLQMSYSAEEYYRNLFKKSEVTTGHNEISIAGEMLEVAALKEKLLDASEEDAALLEKQIEEKQESIINLGQHTGTKNSCSFDPKQFLGWWDGRDIRHITIRDSDLHTYGREDTEEPVWGVPENSRLIPLPEVQEYFTDTNKALHFNSRPVCTMHEYIAFYAIVGRGEGGVDPVGRGRGIRVGERRHPCGAVYYDVIRQFISGPGLQPGSTVQESVKKKTNLNKTESRTADQPTLGTEEMSFTLEEYNSFVNTTLFYIGEDGERKVYTTLEDGKQVSYSDLPDSRKDWQSLLLDYQTVIENTATSREG